MSTYSSRKKSPVEFSRCMVDVFNVDFAKCIGDALHATMLKESSSNLEDFRLQVANSLLNHPPMIWSLDEILGEHADRSTRLSYLDKIMHFRAYKGLSKETFFTGFLIDLKKATLTFYQGYPLFYI